LEGGGLLRPCLAGAGGSEKGGMKGGRKRHGGGKKEGFENIKMPGGALRAINWEWEPDHPEDLEA